MHKKPKCFTWQSRNELNQLTEISLTPLTISWTTEFHTFPEKHVRLAADKNNDHQENQILWGTEDEQQTWRWRCWCHVGFYSWWLFIPTQQTLKPSRSHEILLKEQYVVKLPAHLLGSQELDNSDHNWTMVSRERCFNRIMLVGASSICYWIHTFRPTGPPLFLFHQDETIYLPLDTFWLTLLSSCGNHHLQEVVFGLRLSLRPLWILNRSHFHLLVHVCWNDCITGFSVSTCCELLL